MDTRASVVRRSENCASDIWLCPWCTVLCIGISDCVVAAPHCALWLLWLGCISGVLYGCVFGALCFMAAPVARCVLWLRLWRAVLCGGCVSSVPCSRCIVGSLCFMAAPLARCALWQRLWRAVRAVLCGCVSGALCFLAAPLVHCSYVAGALRFVVASLACCAVSPRSLVRAMLPQAGPMAWLRLWHPVALF